MSIKSFISNLFSSAYKRKQQNDDKNLSSKSQTLKQEENLLANLRKSKLFLDDSDVGLQSKASPLSLHSINEDPNSQAIQEVEKVVGLMHSSSKKGSKSKQDRSRIQNDMVDLAQIIPLSKRSPQKQPDMIGEESYVRFNSSGLSGGQGITKQQLMESLLRSDTKRDGEVRQSTNKDMICEISPNISDNHGGMQNELNPTSSHNGQQKENTFSRNSFSQLESKVIDHSVLPGGTSNIRRCNDANQKLMSAFTFNEEALPVVSVVFNNNSRYSNTSNSEFHQGHSSLIHQIQVNNSNNNQQQPHSIPEIDSQQQKCLSQSDSQSSLQQLPINLQQSQVHRGSSSSSRVRGSSSKKKSIGSGSPLSTKGKRDQSSSLEKYPMLEHFRDNISSIARYQPQVKEDVEGENEGGAAQPDLSESVHQKKQDMEDEENVHILNLSAAHSKSNNFFTMSSSKQFDCLSNKAEPPTQMKQRSNSFFFEQSGDKKKFFNLDDIGSKNSKIASQQSSKNSADKKMFIESPFPNTSFKKNSNSNVMEPENSPAQPINSPAQPETSAFHCDKLSFDEQGNVNSNPLKESSNGSMTGSDSKYGSEYKCKSTDSSPSRVHLNSFHKQIDMMIDKSEILPPQISRSAHKVPSPIKEVDEHSQKNKITPKRVEPDAMDTVNSNHKQENISNFDGSPKMRQKSVKFDSSTPNGEDTADEEYVKLNQKLQSRKPTPYNPFKSQPISYLSRQNKFREEDSSSSSSSESNNMPSSQNGTSISNGVQVVNSIMTSSVDSLQPKGEINLKYPPIFKDVDVNNSTAKDNKSAAPEESSTKTEQPKLADKNEVKKNNVSPFSHTPNMADKKNQIKLPLALKKKETASTIASNNFFKVENTNSTPTVFHSNPASGPSTGSSNGSNKVKNNFAGVANKLNSKTNPLSMSHNIKKLRPDSEESITMSEFVSAQRIKVHDESSLPAPRSIPMRGTMNSGAYPPTQIKTAYKTCIYCQQDIKPRDEVKTFTCCHKAHMSCVPKDKNTRCLRCNSNNMSNKYRPKD